MGKIAAAAPATMRDVSRRLEISAVALAVLAAFLPVSGTTIERLFSTGVYPSIQQVITPVTNLVPFALFDVMTVGAAIALVAAIVGVVRRARRERSLTPVGAALVRLAAVGAAVYLAFLVLWGFNYRRVPMAQRLVMAHDRAPDNEAVVALGFDAVHQLNALHGGAHRAGWESDPRADPSLLASFRAVQGDLIDAPPAVPGRLKGSIYGPYFRWTGVDGMVNPFALEVMANPDLLPFETAFVAAHEWAHLAGFADESEANFVGWLTCVRAGVAAQYSAWLYLYWQVSGEVSAPDRERLRDALGPGPQSDVNAIIERLRRGQLPLLRSASWVVYDQYLRANRVEAGIRSYGEVVTLILRARFDQGWVPVRRPTSASSR